MKKDPAVLFYTSDFLAGTITMTDDEVGKYIKLLCIQHQRGHLPESTMLQMCGGEKNDEIFSKFEVDEDGLYYNERMDVESKKRRAFTESRIKNGLQTKNKGESTCSAHAQHMLSTCLAHAEHMGNGNIYSSKDITTEEELGNGSKEIINPSKGITTEEENENGSKEVESESKTSLMQNRFDRFWDAYPKKTGKAQAQRTFFRIAPSEELTQKILTAIEKQKSGSMWMKNHGEFIPYPSTWLNRGQWDDEVEETQVRTSRAPAARSYAGNAVSRGGREGTVQYTGEEYFGYAGVGLEVPPEARTWGDDHPEGGKNSG